jgi:hypothetical protein
MRLSIDYTYVYSYIVYISSYLITFDLEIIMKNLVTFKPVRALGINSNDCNVYSGGRMIGVCSFDAIKLTKRRNFQYVRPVSDWRATFSVSLKKEFGLV